MISKTGLYSNSVFQLYFTSKDISNKESDFLSFFWWKVPEDPTSSQAAMIILIQSVFLIKWSEYGDIKIIQAIATALGCFLEPEDKSLLLRLPHTSDIEGSKLETSSLKMSFHGTGRHYDSGQRRKTTNSPNHMWGLWTAAMTSLVRYPQRCNSGTSYLVSDQQSSIGPLNWR